MIHPLSASIKKTSAFTLLEVLISLLILAVLVTVVARCNFSMLQAHERTRELSEATHLFERIAAQQQLGVAPEHIRTLVEDVAWKVNVERELRKDRSWNTWSLRSEAGREYTRTISL